MVDAFPSEHTLVSLLILGYGWRLLPRWRLPLSLLVGAILFSTVYLSYHYVVDVVAGALGARPLAWAMPSIGRLCGAPDDPRSVRRS